VQVAQLAIFFDGLENHSFQSFRQFSSDFAWRRRLLVENRSRDDSARPAAECWSSRRHLVEHQSEREQVRTRIEVFTAQLLERHVSDGADRAPRVRQ
jgi:hypothetical protein